MPASLEVITGQRRRRRWTGEEKARIVAESFEEEANISEAARRNGVARGLLDLKVVLAAQPVDFRKSVHTLSALVSVALRANPYCGDVFVFRKAHGQSEASGVGRQRHGAGNEVAALGTLHLAAPAASFNPPKPRKETADQKPKSGKLEYCQKPSQRCSSGGSLFFTDD
jgi:hypothetical protein